MMNATTNLPDNYTVISDDDFYDFIQQVNAHIGAGWKLQGGISVTAARVAGVDQDDYLYKSYYQAMIKDDGARSIR